MVSIIYVDDCRLTKQNSLGSFYLLVYTFKELRHRFNLFAGKSLIKLLF